MSQYRTVTKADLHAPTWLDFKRVVLSEWLDNGAEPLEMKYL